MADADPARQLQIAGAGELALRVASGIVLALVAAGFAYWGGFVFAVFWGIAAIIVLWEWTALVSARERRSALMVGVAAIILAVCLAEGSMFGAIGLREVRLAAALIVLAMGMLATAAIVQRGAPWVAVGIPYAGVLALAPIVLRADPELGFVAILFLFAVVWATDIAAFFVGRALGGPKLAPRLSPKKTWSGCIGGIAGAVMAGVLVISISGVGRLVAAALVALTLSIAAQAGDLFESALKRRFGAKDSGALIPGHGGLMDRLDSFVAAAVLACVIGLVRGGLDAPARGLLVW